MYRRIYPIIGLLLVLVLCTAWGLVFTSGTSIPSGTGVPLQIEAGATANYTDSTGGTWLSDRAYVGGSAATTTNTITNTADPTLFQSYRAAASGNIVYTANPAQGGLFKVTELEVEPTAGAVLGSRKQNITLACDGLQVAAHNQFDILDPTGPCGGATAVNRACWVNDWIQCGSSIDATSHAITITFAPVVGQPLTSGIAVVPQQTAALAVPTPVPTPSGLPQIVQCAAGLTAGTGASVPLTLTVNAGNSLVLFHKGVAANPGVSDTQGNTWTSATAVNTASGGCLNADYVVNPLGTGSDTVTANSPGTGTNNAAVLCTVSSFVGFDTGNGASFTSGVTNALTSAVSPFTNTDALLGLYYIEGTSPAFSGNSSNNIGALGTPSDATLAGTSSNTSQLVGAVYETGTQGQLTSMQRAFTPSGAYCGGIIALSSAIIPATSVTVTCPASVTVGSTAQCSASANLTNGTQQTVTSQASWSVTAGATVNATGLVTGTQAGSITVSAMYGGQTGNTPMTVNASTPFVQFSRNGQILQSYTPGVSKWIRSMFWYDGVARGKELPADLIAAGMNEMEERVFCYPPDNFNSSTYTLSAWHSNCQSSTWGPETTYYNANFAGTDINFMANDQIIYNGFGSTYFAVDTSGNPAWGYSSLADYSTQMHNNMFNIVNAQISIDEANFLPTGAQPNAVQRALLGVAHPPFGFEGIYNAGQSFYNTWANPIYSDFPDQEVQTGFTPGTNADTIRGFMDSATALIPGIQTASGQAVPEMASVWCTGPDYSKRTAGNHYVPGTDCLNNFDNTCAVHPATFSPQAMSPGMCTDEVMYAVAKGYAGIRLYQWDSDVNVNTRNNTTANAGGGTTQTSECQTGTAPLSSYAAWQGIGQDRWMGLAAAYNVVKQVEPYVLQPAITAPTCPSGVVCGAKSGNGGKLVTMVNFSASSHSVTFDPTSYRGAGAAQEWKIVASNNQACGTESYQPPGQTTIQDCGIGITQINNVNWTAGQALPAALAAPTTATTLTLQPTEVDVFLYIQ